MKLLIRFLPLLVLMAAVGCQKEITFEAGQNPGAGSLRMKVNGKQWVADKFAGGSMMAGLINISGQSKDGKTFTVTLSDTVARMYTLTNVITSLDSAHAAAFSDTGAFSNFSWGTIQGDDPSLAGGWFNISQIDRVKKTMSGTFQMKMFREMDSSTLMITEGSFENLTYATSLPPVSTTDTMRVKINGTSWSPASLVGALSSGTLAIVGNENPLNRTVGLMMPQGITPGSYSLDFLGGQYIGIYNPNITTAYASTSGTLTILEHNVGAKRIRGNFNFVAEPVLGGTSAALTEGYFSVKYQ